MRLFSAFLIFIFSLIDPEMQPEKNLRIPGTLIITQLTVELNRYSIKKKSSLYKI